MSRVKSILERKGADVVTVPPSTTVGEVAAILRKHNIGAVVVSRNGLSVDGIYSERDIIRHLAEHGQQIIGWQVSTVMVKTVLTCTLFHDIDEIMKIMTQRRIRHLPVVENDRLAGIVSIGDVVKSRLEDMQLETNVLRDYAIALR